MSVPTDRRYAETHEWHKPEGDLIVIGLTQFAVDQLTDITFVEMKEAGTDFGAGDEIGEVESVKTSSGIYAGVAGEIVEVNDSLGDDPSLLNSDPFGEGWLVKVRPSASADLAALMDAQTYEAKNPS
ncbi:MAG: glycine cleavage system protein GcvH [Phycisphaerales bacterium]|nr:glycine cleavage system protein GcvH [Phycisphaerales bacterium]MCB9836944.1 glycine cleavage system protein GcvH [Phycisphaera sp.]